MARYVYLIQSSESGIYKIGISQNPRKRLEQLQTGIGEELRLIEKYESNYYSKIETALHNRHSLKRVRGEWFDLTLEDEVGFINECRKIENNIKFLNESNNPFI